MARGVPIRHEGLLRLTATKAVQHIAEGSLSAETYASTLLAQAGRMSFLNTIINMDSDALLEAARAVDVSRRRGQTLGRLAGLPLLVKDNIDTKDLPTTAGTPGLLSNRPGRGRAGAESSLQGGSAAVRQGESARASGGPDGPQLLLRPGAQSVRPDHDLGREQRRDGRGNRRAAVPGRPGHRHGRVGARSGGAVRRGRLATDQGSLSDLADLSDQPHVRHGGVDRSNGRRCGASRLRRDGDAARAGCQAPRIAAWRPAKSVLARSRSRAGGRDGESAASPPGGGRGAGRGRHSRCRRQVRQPTCSFDCSRPTSTSLPTSRPRAPGSRSTTSSGRSRAPTSPPRSP